MQKRYHLDTNILMEDENSIENLRNGEENEIYISITVINELDKLSKVNDKRPKVKSAIQDILNNKEDIHFTGNINALNTNDDKILDIVCDPIYKNDVLVTNDIILQLKAYIRGIKAEGYRSSIPFQSESQKYTGFID
jgi:PhoH-like ATPase